MNSRLEFNANFHFQFPSDVSNILNRFSHKKYKVLRKIFI